MSVVLASSVRVLAHHARVVNSVTGGLVRDVTATLEDAPPGWTFRLREGVAVVSVREGSNPPPETPSVLFIVQPSERARLVEPARTSPGPGAPVDPEWSVRVDLDEPATVGYVDPGPAAFEVHLAEPTSGNPRTGRTVALRATQGATPRPTVPLGETAPGIYSTGPHSWTIPFLTADLLVDGSLLRTVAVDITRSITRVHLVDTT